MPYPSHIARNALRSALRNHHDSALVLSGRLVNSLSLADLKAALAALGCDPDAITENALRNDPGIIAAQTLPQDATRTFCARCDSASVDGCTDIGCPHTPKRPRTSKRIDVHDWHQAASTADIMERVEHLRQLRQPGPVDLGDADNARDQDSLFAELAELEAELDTRALVLARQLGDTSEPEPEVAEPEPEVTEPDPVETEVQTIRSLIVTGGFSALDERLRELVTEARKPPVTVEVMVPGPTVEVAPVGPGIHVAKTTGKSATWRALFGVGGALGKRETALWDGTHPNTPRVNDRYLWPHPQTETALTQVARGRNIMLYGPAGTGKTEWAQQLAARTGRPFALISCDNGTDAATLVGMTVPDASGGVTWQDGQLTRAIKTPGCVVCLDEPSVARPGALFVMQNVLANRVLFVAETGARVPVASGVVFIATDNTNGTGGGARRGYTDTNRLNAAFLDRFGVRVKVDYLPNDREADVIVGYTGCTRELAQLLVSAATLTRAAADSQTLSHGIGLRRLLSWAELLMDGIGPEEAFRSAVLNCASEQDVETLREQCLLTYDKRTVANALNPAAPMVSDPAVTNPTPAGREAAGDFDPGNSAFTARVITHT